MFDPLFTAPIRHYVHMSIRLILPEKEVSDRPILC